MPENKSLIVETRNHILVQAGHTQLCSHDCAQMTGIDNTQNGYARGCRLFGIERLEWDPEPVLFRCAECLAQAKEPDSASLCIY
jgi:hypothetical protein